MLRISHPRPELGHQEFLGVDFVDGVATVDELHPEREIALRLHGATIRTSFADVDLRALSKPELLDLARGIDLPPKATKPQIIEALGG